MPYIGRNHTSGDHVNNFKVLDDISSYTATFDGTATSVVNTTNDTIRVPEHRFIQGQRVIYTNGGGGNIGGLTTGTAYFIIADTGNTFKLATSASNATSSTAINLSSVGTGTSHTINASFDGVNTRFKITHGNGVRGDINSATQLNIAINNVIQRPNINSASFTEGFSVEDQHKLVFKTAPTSNDIFWGSIIANNLSTFDVSDHKIDTFTGNGSTTEFNLSHVPANNESLMVTINGVLQHPSNATTSRAYTLIASVLKFTAAPANGDEIQVRHLGFAGATTSDVSGFYGRTGNVVLTDQDDITVNKINVGTGVTIESNGQATFVGVVTFGSGSTTIDNNVVNVGTALTLGHTQGLQFHTQNLHSAGFEVNQINTSGIITASSLDISGNASIGGILTYEDVTSIDAVGIVTARDGIFIPDNKKLQFGNAAGSADLEIFHSSSENKTIIDNNTNDLDIASDVIRLKNSARSETLATFIGNGGVSLYYDNSIKLGTAGWGIQATGILKIVDATDSSGATNHLALGASNDLKLFHDGSNSYITNTTGTLLVQNSGNVVIDHSGDFYVRSHNGNETRIRANNNGAVELYHDNSKRLETTASGISVTGEVSTTGHIRLPDNMALIAGNGSDLFIYHNGSSSVIDDVGTGSLKIQTNGTGVDIQKGSSETIARFIADGEVQLYHDNDKKFQTQASGAKIFNTAGSGGTRLEIQGQEGQPAYLQLNADDGDDNADYSRIYHGTDGSVYFQNYTSGSWETNIKTTGNGAVELYYDNVLKLNTASAGVIVTNGHLRLNRQDTSNEGGEICFNRASDNANQWFNDVYGNDSSARIRWHSGGTEYLSLTPNSELTAKSGIDIKIASDSGKFLAGTSGDLQIYHDGSHSYIDNNTGSLRFRDAGGAEKFRISGTGTQFNDDISLSNDNDKLNFGAGNDLQIYSTGARAYIDHVTGGTGSDLWLRTKTFVVSNYTNDEYMIVGNENGSVNLYWNNLLKFNTAQYGVVVTGSLAASNIDLEDNGKCLIGTGDDLELFHNGSNSFIKNNTGYMVISSENGSTYYDADNHYFRKDGTAENMAKFLQDGAVELYYDNAKKFQTTSSGVTITGTLLADKLQVYDGEHVSLGNDNDLRLYFDGSNSAWNNSTGNSYFYGGGGNFYFRPVNAEQALNVLANGSVELFFDNVKKFETTSGGSKVTGNLIVNSGHVSIDVDSKKLLLGAGDDLSLTHDGSHSIIKNITNYLYYRSTQHRFENAAGNQLQAAFLENDSVQLYFSGSKKFETSSTGANLTGSLNISSGNLAFLNSGHQIQTGSSGATFAIQGGATNPGGRIEFRGGNSDGDIRFFSQGTTSTKVERVRIAHSLGGNFKEICFPGQNTSTFAQRVYRTTVNANAQDYVKFATVSGPSYASHIKMGTTSTIGNVVTSADFDIKVGHSSDILVISKTLAYTNITIKVISNGNQNFDLYIKRSGGSNASSTSNHKIAIHPMLLEQVSFNSTINYSGQSHVHTTSTGAMKITGAGGPDGHIIAQGNITGNSKNFSIPHPIESLSSTKKLVHASIESPQLDLIYRGKVDLVDGTATVNIDSVSGMSDGTFVLLNRDVQCFTTNETGWTNVKGTVSGNVLTIIAQDNNCTDTISWMVIGERQDDNAKLSNTTDDSGNLIVEPPTDENVDTSHLHQFYPE